MSDAMSPVTRYAQVNALDALDDLASEIAIAETVPDALRIYDVLASVSNETDRLERAALDRADALLKGGS